MWKKLNEWFDLFVDLFRKNGLFASKAANIILVCMALLYVSFISKAIIENSTGNGPAPLAPITIQQVRLLNTNIRVDQSIFVVLNGTVNIPHCSIYAIGSVIDSNNNVLFDKITALSPDQLDDALNNKTPIKLNVGILSFGSYIFRVEFHAICSGKSYVILAPLVPFEVKR